MEIVQYNNYYKQDFIALNTAWIVDLFGQLEKEDMETFRNIEKDIAEGAMIYFAIENGSVMANCMVRNIGNNTWELCKLGAPLKFSVWSKPMSCNGMKNKYLHLKSRCAIFNN